MSKQYINFKVKHLWNRLYDYKNLIGMKEGLEEEYNELSMKVYDLGTPKSPKFDKTVFSQNHEEYSSLALGVFDDQKKIQNRIKTINEEIEKIWEIINSVEDAQIKKCMIFIFVDGHRQEELEQEFPYSRRAIEFKIKNELKKIILEKDIN